jgi:phage terminase small subunit
VSKKKQPKKRAKTGSSKIAAAARRLPFVHAYLNNGQNITQAAITIGCSPRSAATLGHRLFKHVETQALIKQEQDRASAAAGLSVERTLRELARVAYSDPGNYFDKAGKPIPICDLDEDARRALASWEIEEQYEGKGEKRTLAGFIKRAKLWDKNAAIEKAMKYHKLYSDDAPQTGAAVIIIQATILDRAV